MKQYGVTTVERLLREGIDPGLQVFFDCGQVDGCDDPAVAGQLEYIQADRHGNMTIYGYVREFGGQTKCGHHWPCTLSTLLYLSKTDIINKPIAEIIAQSRVVPKDHTKLSTLRQGFYGTYSGRTAPSPANS